MAEELYATLNTTKGDVVIRLFPNHAPKKKTHRLRKVVLFLGFGALAAAAVKKLLTPPEPAWQSTPTSGRDYSSAPTGTTSRPETKPETKPETEAAAKAEAPSANGKTDAPKAESPKAESPKAETPQTDSAKAETEVNAAANGATKKAPTTRKTSDPKSSDS